MLSRYSNFECPKPAIMAKVDELQPVRPTGVHDVGGLDLALPLNLEEKPLAFWERQVLTLYQQSRHIGACGTFAAAKCNAAWLH